MTNARIIDQRLWLAQIEDEALCARLSAIATGQRIDLLVDGQPILFEREAESGEASASPSFRPVGEAGKAWQAEFFPGEERDVDIQFQRRNPAMRVVAMPADTNPYGDIFGGWLMSLMDAGAGLVAARKSKGRAVTVAMDGVEFHKPVKVGDEVSVYATIERTGRTSMSIFTEAWRRERHSEDAEKVTHATFTFVAVDDKGCPRAVEE